MVIWVERESRLLLLCMEMVVSEVCASNASIVSCVSYRLENPFLVSCVQMD